MSLTRKKSSKKRLKKRKAETVIIITEQIKSEDTLFPEKVAKMNKILDDNPHLLDGL
jgi:hypothetical protein